MSVCRNGKRLARVVRRGTLALAVGAAFCFGCRTAPFYRMTSKASMSLPLSREGVAAYERGDLNLAEEKFEEALKLNDADVETNRYYGETLWKQGKRKKAMQILTAAASRNGAVDAEASLCRSLSEKSLELDDGAQAMRWANKIIDLTPKSSKGWELRGRALRKLGRRREALLDLQRAAHFSVDDKELLREIAALQNELGDYDAALASWQCLERLYPTNREPAEIFAGIGGACLGLGLLPEAEEAYETAVRYEPKEPEYRVRLAETVAARGDWQRATLALDDAVEKEEDPDRQQIYVAAKQRIEQIALATGQAPRYR